MSTVNPGFYNVDVGQLGVGFEKGVNEVGECWYWVLHAHIWYKGEGRMNGECKREKEG